MASRDTWDGKIKDQDLQTCKVLPPTPFIPTDLEEFLEIHNPKVGSSSLPRAIIRMVCQISERAL